MKAKRIVAFTCEDDLHTAAVAKCVEKSGYEFVSLERETYGREWTISAKQVQTLEVVVETQTDTFGLSDIGAMWSRREFTAETGCKEDTPEGEYIAEQSAIHVNSIAHYLCDRIPCMNHPQSNWRARSKLVQSSIATKNGLRVPKTFQGGSPGVAASFLASCTKEEQLCIKPLEATLLKKDDGTAFAHYASLFKRRPESELSTLKDCPVILQNFIEKDYEIRATVVGDEIFAASIDTKDASPEARVDWRHYDWANTPYGIVELPHQIKQSMRQIMSEMSLAYGAFDLIKDVHDDYYFLEVNSQGQWLWVEDLTDLPITRAVADWLVSHAKDAQV